jgi:hypothetical protein
LRGVALFSWMAYPAPILFAKGLTLREVHSH